ncbi:GNAT family N-acetyltransferase [Solimicrobium silvestre]|uniref:L-ornithine N(alpha)-acyltransferase n=1 Tax=Solimicrobium silvestre TaxID=2099400 RepID=A0A2S9GZ68_9BURK|nr:GNAT family N-acyltransferase [Solimicrobium silvestre]PRC93021.1 putative hemolysin [Solimicrobium silvestre]
MRLLTSTSEQNSNFSKLSLSLASSPEEVREVQRLRYKVFIETMGLSTLENPEGLDKDEFDDYCDHLIVRDSKNLKIVGTYRVLGPHSARKIGRYYSESEFDLSRFAHIRDQIAEAGRACIHPDYRSGAVIMMLWAGLAAFMRREQCNYLVGCASISLADGGMNANALFNSLKPEEMAPIEYRVTPILPFPLSGEVDGSFQKNVPPLLKGYLRAGAWVCGEPAWDPDFHCADLFLLLPLENLDGRYSRHYLKDKAE